jgi:hypothetical protein
MKPDATAPRGIESVGYSVDGGFHQIRWRWSGDPRAFGLESTDLKRLIQAVMVAVAGRGGTEAAVYQTALQSIAANTCCDQCREAALVARRALDEAGGMPTEERACLAGLQ